MIGQRTLRSFFSPLPAGEKRSRVSEPNQDAEEAPKRPKANSTSAARWPPATAAAALTPEQLERIRKNKEAAQQRLASRTVVVSAAPEMAPGWKAALAPEFAKPYFPQVGHSSNTAFPKLCSLRTPTPRSHHQQQHSGILGVPEHLQD
ncbi:uracil-DNA glycosylase-like [Sceloporus undulatus]|uniref:uracil-DNA glycosylase-like n=1 Tax=Sceloporus undulatus TaxID=8520 RepID=UPI001C4B6823|nr:uracil-DNA glycosylase-like [Sceloporus undulatus]